MNIFKAQLVSCNILFCFFVIGYLFQVPTVYAQNFVPTFNCIGIYYSSHLGSKNNECQVRYREVGTSSWEQANSLWFDERNQEYRGSIFNLQPGVKYEIQLSLVKSLSKTLHMVTTWSENFPIREVVYLEPQSNETFVVNKSGDADGYILYTSKPNDKATIDIQNDRDYGIEIAKNTSFVIIRGLKVMGPALHGIFIGNGSHDIVIEENDISNWGSVNDDGWAINYHAAVYAKSETVSKIIIQRNKLHHPRGDSNSWDELRVDRQTYHPGGAHAICFVNTYGNHVIRYNEIFSDDQHYFCDGLGGSTDYSFEGFPNKDSDIYGNRISHCWDDGIESEGGNQNVRIWGNYIDKTYAKIAIAATSVGPLYIFRNVVNTSRKSGVETDSDLYGRGPFIKAGGKVRGHGVWYGGGRTYIFHNTTLQLEETGKNYTLGGSSAILSSGGELYNAISRNNIFLTYKPTGSVIIDKTNSCSNDFDHDLYNGHVKNQCPDRPHQQHGVRLMKRQLPEFQNAGDEFQYFLMPSTTGSDQGIIIPNINDNYQGKGPDMGAYEYDSPPLEFGVNAYLDNN